MDTKYEKLIEVIINSMREIDKKYFHFEVAGGQEPIKRERPYCAELYHQMRLRNDKIEGKYDVTFEPDKIKHPIIEAECGPVAPDLIVHNSGDMGAEDNLGVIEVKTSEGDLTDGIEKDVNTINCMTTVKNGYYGGILIVYGELTARKRKNLLERIKENKKVGIRRFTLLLQSAPGEIPESIEL
jgi:hypothetical protein